MQRYVCETCKNSDCEFYIVLHDEDFVIIRNAPPVRAIHDFIYKYGCASHSYLNNR
jgi:hypothetical protein